MKEEKNDLRYIKTKEIIHSTFRELLKTMPYHKITVKLLAEKARINRKTFYLHYDTLEELLEELRCDIVLTGIAKIQQYKIPQDLRKIIFVIYDYWQSLTPDDSKIFHTTSASSNTFTFAQQMRETFTNFDSSFCHGEIERQKTTLAFIMNAIGIFYQEWTLYHAFSSIDEAVDSAYQMITDGISTQINP